VVVYVQSYHPELNSIFHSVVAIAALLCRKLSTLGHMNVLYMHISLSPHQLFHLPGIS